jgi:hypothetical protein
MSTIVEVQGGYEVYTERGINIEVNNAKGAQGATGATGAQGVPGQDAPERKILIFRMSVGMGLLYEGFEVITKTTGVEFDLHSTGKLFSSIFSNHVVIAKFHYLSVENEQPDRGFYNSDGLSYSIVVDNIGGYIGFMEFFPINQPIMA